MRAVEVKVQIKKLYPEIESDVLQGFNAYRLNIKPNPENIAEMQGWTVAWGYYDRRNDSLCFFPTDTDYMNGWEMLD